MTEPLLSRVRNRSSVVGVVGLGHVGLPFALEKATVDIKVIGMEANLGRAASFYSSESAIDDVDSSELAGFVRTGRLSADADFDRASEMDVIFIWVPTSLSNNLAPDLRYVETVANEFLARIQRGQHRSSAPRFPVALPLVTQ